jgi:hypothetical protein
MNINELVFSDCGDPAKATEDQKEHNNAVFYFCLSNMEPGLTESGVFCYQTLSWCCGSGTINSESGFGSRPKLNKKVLPFYCLKSILILKK